MRDADHHTEAEEGQPEVLRGAEIQSKTGQGLTGSHQNNGGEQAAEYNNELYAAQSEEMIAALEDAGCTVAYLEDTIQEEFKNACLELYKNYEADGTWTEGLYDRIQDIISE